MDGQVETGKITPSPQPVNANDDQCQRFLLCVTSRDSPTKDGTIEAFNADDSKGQKAKAKKLSADVASLFEIGKKLCEKRQTIVPM
ncbi:hypothetical protein SNK04_002547 [Fusarium graminearum]